MNPFLDSTEVTLTMSDLRQDVALCYAPLVSSENRFLGLYLHVTNNSVDEHNLGAIIGALTPFVRTVPGDVIFAHRGYVLSQSPPDLPCPNNLVLVTPALDLGEHQTREILTRWRSGSGMRLAIDGRSDTPLPRHMIPFFDYALIRENEDRRRKQDPDAPTAYRRIPYITIGDVTQDGIEAAFFAGAIAAVGWPKTATDLPQLTKPSQPPQISAARFLAAASRRAEESEIAAALSLTPAIEARLAKLIQVIDSDCAPTGSFSDVLAARGHDALVRLFSVLLLTSSRDFKHIALVYASIVRAFFVAILSPKHEQHDAFLAALLSLADRITDTATTPLLELINASESVKLLISAAPALHQTRMNLVVAIEDVDQEGLALHMKVLDLDQSVVNKALLRSLDYANAIIKVFQPN